MIAEYVGIAICALQGLNVFAAFILMCVFGE